MQKPLLLFLLCFLAVIVNAQPFRSGKDSSQTVLKNYALLPDQGYTFEKVLTDTSLAFITNDSIRPASANCYWIKILATNTGRYDGAYNLRISPYFNNTFFHWNDDAGKWVEKTAGVTVKSDKNRLKGILPIMLRGQTPTIIWVKMDLGSSTRFLRTMKPVITLEKEITTDNQESFLWLIWVISMAILIPLMCNSLYVYFKLGDKSSLYLALGQLGGIIYVTTSRRFFSTFFFCPPFTFGILSDGDTYSYSLNTLLMHISVALIIYGFVRLTQTYLTTGKTMPGLDAFLRYGLFTYLIFTLVVALINCFLFCIDIFLLPYDNMLVGLLTGAIITSIVLGYKRRLPGAVNFLLANILPLMVVLMVAVKNVFTSPSRDQLFWLADLAVIFQAVGFSVAIAARIRTMKKELRMKEMETHQLAFEIQEIAIERQMIELENLQIHTDLREMTLRQKSMELLNQQKNEDIREEKNRSGALQQKLEANQRELASATLYMTQKNEMLASLKSQIKELNTNNPGFKHSELQGINSILQSSLYLDEDWAKFKLHFEQVHPHFFEELKIKHPALTRNETRLYAYLHINLSAKEIAALLNIDPTSVHRAKTRLLKKMSLAENNPS